MSQELKQAAFSSFSILIRPIAKLMLRCGVSWKELCELLKLAYVDIASENYGKFGRPANASRIAILTGLNRREVKRARDQLAAQRNGVFESLGKMDHSTRVLSGWHQDPQFLDAKAKPKLLALKGRISFETLTKKYAPDIPLVAMLKELKLVGAVRETPTGRLRATSRLVMRTDQDAASIVRVGSVIADLASTVAYNETRGDKPSSFERRASNLLVKRAALRGFRDFLERRGMAFLEDADQWLSDHEAKGPDDKPIRVGVGVYLIKDD